MTDITQNSTRINLALWSKAFATLKEGDFTSDDVEYIEATKGRLSHEYTAAYALHHLSEHDHVEGDENAVRAVLLAAKTWRNSAMISPADVFAIADNFVAYFGSWDDALDEHLRDVRPDIQYVEWLSEKGREAMRSEMIRDSEIWIDSDNLPGVRVFKKPGYSY